MRSSTHNGRLLAAAECVISVALATAAALLLDEANVDDVAVLYLLAVLFVAIRRGWPAAIGTGLLSVLALNWFFVAPRHRLTVADPENVVALVVFMIVAVVVGRLAATARSRAAEANRRAEQASAREREAELLGAAASAVLEGDDVATQIANLGASIGSSAGASGARVELASAPSTTGRELAIRLPTNRRPAWLYVTRDTGWQIRDLERLAAPLAQLVDVALEREQTRLQMAEVEAARRADVAKTAVLHAISHDLRSPLTGITTAAGGLRTANLNDEDRAELVAVIESESARLAGLVDDLLDLSRIQAGAAEPRKDWCDLHEIINRAAAHVRVSRREAEIEIDLPGDLPLVRADSAQLERVFSNLIDNAARFSPAHEPVRVTGGASANNVTVRVTDMGKGIPQSQRAQIFEPFFRGDRASGGSGLGLAICRGFVEANDGRIALQTGAGKGTSFAVSLPLVPQPSPAA